MTGGGTSPKGTAFLGEYVASTVFAADGFCKPHGGLWGEFVAGFGGTDAAAR